MVRPKPSQIEGWSPSPGAAPTTTAASATSAREAASAAARAGRCERRAEPRRKIPDDERSGAGAEVSRRADPVDPALVVHGSRHQQVGALEDALGDSERDPIDQVALPELEGRRRRFLQAREVRQVAAEGVPALGFGLAGGGPAAPERRPRGGEDERDGVRGGAEPERDPDDVAPPRRHGAEAVNARPQQHDREHGEDGDPGTEEPSSAARKPALSLDRVTDALL